MNSKTLKETFFFIGDCWQDPNCYDSLLITPLCKLTSSKLKSSFLYLLLTCSASFSQIFSEWISLSARARKFSPRNCIKLSSYIFVYNLDSVSFVFIYIYMMDCLHIILFPTPVVTQIYWEQIWPTDVRWSCWIIINIQVYIMFKLNS